MSDFRPLRSATPLLATFGFLVSIVLSAVAHSQQAAVDVTTQLVVMVSGDLEGAPTIGAGIVFGRDPNGFFVVTANHVVRRGIREATKLRVLLRALPHTWLDAYLLPKADPNPPGLDVAVLRVNGLEHDKWNACALEVDRLGSSDSLRRGASVFPVGYPGGAPWGMPVMPDLVAQVVGNEITFQSAVIANGHSGGALITDGGALVGMLRLDNPPFGVAVSIGAVLNRLRQWGYPVELRASESAAPLFAAVEKHDVAGVERALRDHCVAIDSRHEGWTALQAAATSGDVVIVRSLLAAGASKDLRVDNEQHQQDGMTPMALAASAGHVEVIRLLLKAGGGTEDRGELANSRTPLEYAVWGGHPEAARLLRDAGASTAFLHHVKIRYHGNMYPLHVVADDGNVAVARLLLELGADVNAVDPDGYTPLHRAVEYRQREMVGMLIAAGARPNTYRAEQSPLGAAIMRVPSEILVSKENVRDREIVLAIIEMLVRAGADVKQVDGRDKERRTALDLAAQWGRLSVVKRLLALGVDVNLKNGRGETALYEAVAFDGDGATQRALLETLRAAGATLNAVDNDGDPPLCEAVYRSPGPALGRIEVIELLLNWGERPRLTEQCRYGSGEGDTETINKLLRSRGATETPAH